MTSVLLRSRVLSVVDIFLIRSFAAPLVGSLGNELNVTTLQPNIQDLSSYEGQKLEIHLCSQATKQFKNFNFAT